MAEGKRVLCDEGIGDINGAYTETEFFEYIGTKMNLSGSSSYKRFLIFWKEEDDELDSTFIRSRSPSPSPPPKAHNWVIKDGIRKALEHVDLAYSTSILAQFWAPLMIDGRCLLQTLYQPFGMTNLGKGLSSYRKLCSNSNFYYSCSSTDGGGDWGRVHLEDGAESVVLTGPPSRVFSNGLPEYSPDVEFYSDKEFPLKGDALSRRIKNYMAVPVFGIDSQLCVGVLELLCATGSKGEMDKPAYVLGLMSTALQGVGLRTSAYACHFDMENHLAKIPTGRTNALSEIRMALEEACTEHNLPFAQTWTNMEFKGYTPFVLTTRNDDEYYQSQLSFSIFRDTCESFHLPIGGGLVWKAFNSGGSCFCKDISQLSISDYPFSHVAKKVMLTASFAICLKSHHDPGNPEVYVLELFLPSSTANQHQLLEPVLLTMEKYFTGFTIGSSGQKLGSKMTVEVLQVFEDNDRQESFTLFPNSTVGSGSGSGSCAAGHELVMQGSNLESFWDKESVHGMGLTGTNKEENLALGYQESMEDVSFVDLFSNDASNIATSVSFGRWEDHSSNTPSMKETGSGYHNSSVSTSRVPDQDASGSTHALPQMNRETIEKHFGLTLKEAAECFKVSPTTLKRRCREVGIPTWPRKKFNRNRSIANPTESGSHSELNDQTKAQDGGRFQLMLHSAMSAFVAPAKDTTTSGHSASQLAPAVPIRRYMTIKARYGKVIRVRFRLPFSSSLLHLEREVASRLRLEMGSFKMGSFKIWYLDDDNEFVLLTCDADLREMESMGMSINRVYVTDLDSAPEY